MGGRILFKCTVCSGRFTSKGGWLRHLFEPRHRDLARVELIKKWRVEETRKCLIVVYSKGNVGKDEGIVQYFSKDIYKGFVGDFVWWEERPGIGFILFESRQTVKNLMKSLVQCNEISVDGQIFQVKVGQDFLDFEWDELLPLTVRAEIEPVLPLLDPGGDNQDNLNGASWIKKENEDSDLEIIEIADTSHASSAPVIILDSPQPQEEELIVDLEEKEEYLSRLLSYISSEVQIPSRETSVILNQLCRINKVLTKKTARENAGRLETRLIGNFSLRLKYHGEEYPSVFVGNVTTKKKKIQSTSNILLHRKLLDSKEYYTKKSKKKAISD